MYTKTLVTFVVLVALSLVGNLFLQKSFSKRLVKEAGKELAAGNYLSSLAKYNSAAERTFGETSALAEQKTEEAKDLLVAGVNFEKAKKAAEEGDWLETKALLTGDPAVINTSFVYYREAIELFLEASEKVKALEEKIDTELKKLKVEAAEEKKLRENAEVKITETQTQLQSTIAEKTKTEQVLRSEIEQKASEAAQAKAQAEAERLQKFKNELDVYVSMLTKGNGYLTNALFEINKSTSSFLIIGIVEQAKALFDEAEIRGKNLLDERTPESLKTYVQKLLQASALFLDASQRMGSLVYTGKENESEFQRLSQEISEGRNTALQITQELQNFVR
ncbi:MAG: hypothetical protein HYT93_02420 [Parcubacteria group bacterium]|nr:hypothetical protein [Parcubacteria group bacterium]